MADKLSKDEIIENLRGDIDHLELRCVEEGLGMCSTGDLIDAIACQHIMDKFVLDLSNYKPNMRPRGELDGLMLSYISTELRRRGITQHHCKD